jgi:GR25 family glycosyltransferase involved in LPS biosynthesis
MDTLRPPSLPSPSSPASSTPSWRIQQIPAFCITLERRLDRWKRFQTQPGVQEIPVKRFLGVDGKTLNLQTEERIATMTKRNILTKSRRSHEELNSIGGVGCALSHIAVWQWMVDHQAPLCLVFEDDAVVPPGFADRANRLIQTTLLQDKNAWDLWLLGGNWDDLVPVPPSTQGGVKLSNSSIPQENPNGIQRIGSFVFFHAYVMTLPMAQRLVRDAYPIHAHIDLWTSVYAFLNDLRVVGSPVLRLEQNPKSPTDIQTAPDCALCDIPSDFHKTHRVVPHLDHYIAQATKIALLVLGVGYAVRSMTRRG